MARLTPSHVAGLDLIDKLFFNQILVSCRFSEELHWLNELDRDLESELTGRGLTGLHRQLVKHCVTCLLEADLSDSMLLLKEAYPDALPDLPPDLDLETHRIIEEYQRHYFKAVVLAMLSKTRQCDSRASIQISDKLVEKYRKAPATFRYRLTDRLFAWNFIAAPVDCFTWLSKMGILKSTKHPGEALTARYGPEFLQRLVLLCELDELRSFMRRAVGAKGSNGAVMFDEISRGGDLTPEAITSLMSKAMKELQVTSMPHLRNSFPYMHMGRLEHPATARQFFDNLNNYSVRVRVFQGVLSSWAGMLCAGIIEVLDVIYEEKTAIYVADFNDGTLTDRISKGMSSRGFEITARVIYERHRDFKETILKAVDTYYCMKLGENVAYLPHSQDITYDAISMRFSLLKPSPRRSSKTRS